MHLIEQDISIIDLAVHKVGNKLKEEELKLSTSLLQVDDHIKELLSLYFLKPFKSRDHYEFHHETNIELNEVYTYASKIFENPDAFLEQSQNLAKHLYESSNHHQIKGGEFYVVFFEDCYVEGVTTNAIGIFKSENKETYLKVYSNSDNFEIAQDDGININKLDKGCIIFDYHQPSGYLVSIVDNTNKGEEAQYWRDNFLRIQRRNDNFFKTENSLQICKQFVGKMDEEFDLNKMDQAELLQNTSQFFKEQETFSASQFAEDVLENEEVKESFKHYAQSNLDAKGFQYEDEFQISDTAVKQGQKYFKSVIKLDRNFHLYIHGNRNRVERGFDDEKGMNFYTLYFEEEH